jgi:hypothetical protein
MVAGVNSVYLVALERRHAMKIRKGTASATHQYSAASGEMAATGIEVAKTIAVPTP